MPNRNERTEKSLYPLLNETIISDVSKLAFRKICSFQEDSFGHFKKIQQFLLFLCHPILNTSQQSTSLCILCTILCTVCHYIFGNFTTKLSTNCKCTYCKILFPQNAGVSLLRGIKMKKHLTSHRLLLYQSLFIVLHPNFL